MPIGEQQLCSFCGKSSTEVGYLIKGPGVAICNGCVRVCYQILESLPEQRDGAPAGDDVMTSITAAQQLALDGHRDQARQAFAGLWERIGQDGDPLHRVTLAHYLADLQEDAEEELVWDQRALDAADSLTDERAKQYHATLAVRGFYPSLHLNLATDLAKLDRLDDARRHLARAVQALPDLPEGGYGDLIRSSIDSLRERLDSTT